MKDIVLSEMGHTWIIDLDGTIVKHNGYKINKEDSFIAGAYKFLLSIPEQDMIIFLTSRKKTFSDITEKFLKKNNIRYDYIIYDAPYGERILINDSKPSGLQMAKCICTSRDEKISYRIMIDKKL